MTWAATVKLILQQHSLANADLLGEGDEAQVYALGPDHVVRIGKAPADRGLTTRRRAFYAALDPARVSFRLPTIVQEADRDGVSYSVERRIAGRSLANALPDLEGAARQRALTAYAETATSVRRIGYAQDGFGEVLAAPPVRSAAWADFMLSRAGGCLAAHHRIAEHVGQADRALGRLEYMLAPCGAVRPELVHGDYYPANLMVGADGPVTGLIDFGLLTVMGDWRMDAAGAVLYLTGMAGITPEDKRIVLDHLKEHRLFYAFRLLDTSKAGLLRWCVDTIRSAC